MLNGVDQKVEHSSLCLAWSYVGDCDSWQIGKQTKIQSGQPYPSCMAETTKFIQIPHAMGLVPPDDVSHQLGNQPCAAEQHKNQETDLMVGTSADAKWTKCPTGSNWIQLCSGGSNENFNENTLIPDPGTCSWYACFVRCLIPSHFGHPIPLG